MSIRKQTARLGLLVSLSLILGWVERLIPLDFMIPGIKLGLGNIAVLLGMVLLNPKSGFLILVAKILLSGFMFGQLSGILYGLAGGILAFAAMYAGVRFGRLRLFTVSILGAVGHNTGQVLMALAVTRTPSLLVYWPILVLIGLLTGGLTGVLTQMIVSRVKME